MPQTPPPPPERPNQRFVYHEERQLGFIPIHKNGSTAINKALREANGWEMVRYEQTLDPDFPRIGDILCVVRNPVDRWVSSVWQSAHPLDDRLHSLTHAVRAVHENGELYTNGTDRHFQPQAHFLQRMAHIGPVSLRLPHTYGSWFVRYDLIRPERSNEAPEECKALIRSQLLTPEVEGWIHEYYAIDFELLEHAS